MTEYFVIVLTQSSSVRYEYRPQAISSDGRVNHPTHAEISATIKAVIIATASVPLGSGRKSGML